MSNQWVSKAIEPMQSINILVSGKTDTELLEAVVSCITDNEHDMIAALRNNTNYSDKTKANVEVIAAIVSYIQNRKPMGQLVVENTEYKSEKTNT